jgi:hypothetical protein
MWKVCKTWDPSPSNLFKETKTPWPSHVGTPMCIPRATHKLFRKHGNSLRVFGESAIDLPFVFLRPSSAQRIFSHPLRKSTQAESHQPGRYPSFLAGIESSPFNGDPLGCRNRRHEAEKSPSNREFNAHRIGLPTISTALALILLRPCVQSASGRQGQMCDRQGFRS